MTGTASLSGTTGVNRSRSAAKIEPVTSYRFTTRYYAPLQPSVSRIPLLRVPREFRVPERLRRWKPKECSSIWAHQRCAALYGIKRSLSSGVVEMQLLNLGNLMIRRAFLEKSMDSQVRPAYL
jgi:hypothetical protein